MNKIAERSYAIFTWAVAGVLCALGAALALPVEYESVARVLLPLEGPGLPPFSLNLMADLARVEERRIIYLYLALLRSRLITCQMAVRFPTLGANYLERPGLAQKRLAAATDIVVGKDGSASIHVRNGDPQLAADMANAYIEQLDRLLRVVVVASAARFTIEREIEEARGDSQGVVPALEQRELRNTAAQAGEPEISAIPRYLTIEMGWLAEFVARRARIEYMIAQNPDVPREQRELAALEVWRNAFECNGPAGPPFYAKIQEGMEYLRQLREFEQVAVLAERLGVVHDTTDEQVPLQVLERAVRAQGAIYGWKERLLFGFACLMLVGAPALSIAVAASGREHTGRRRAAEAP